MKRWLWLAGAAVAVFSVGLAASRVEARRIVRHPAAEKAPAGNVELYRSAILVDAESGSVLFEKNAHLAGPPASMTKMMLMLLIAERVRDGSLHWDDPIPTSAWASKIGGSQVYLKQGEVFSLAEMMQAITIHSANDAAVAVAEAVAGSSEAFVELMNERAKELGMRDTVYHSVHGLPPGKGQSADVSSAFDLATVARAVVKYPDIMKWSGTKEAPFRNGAMTLTNTNRLVRETGWVDGLKTGYYREAGFNVTATAKRDGLRLISVVMGAPQKRDCFAQAAALLSKGFADYKALVAVKKGDTVANDVAVSGGKPHFVRVVAGGDVAILAKRAEKRKFSLELSLPGKVLAPLSANAEVGQVVVKDGDAVVGTVPALAADPVEKQNSIWDRLF
ncbi:MAG: D-alanyl-D-alanine carboxypeptidase family protein [Candidatus Binatia bacterium]